MNPLRWLTGCTHARYSRVWTDPETRQKYVVCTACKQPVPYDWRNMRLQQTGSVWRRWLRREATNV